MSLDAFEVHARYARFVGPSRIGGEGCGHLDLGELGVVVLLYYPVVAVLCHAVFPPPCPDICAVYVSAVLA
jgi:hypothetical protein